MKKYWFIPCLIAFFSFALLAREENGTRSPKLLIMVVFDQFRGDYIERWKPLFGQNGFVKLTAEGCNFTNCHYPYALTVTGAGHATLGTGCGPNKHGIIGNDWYDRTAKMEVYCATEDRYTMMPEGAKSKNPGSGSPGRLLVPTLGDMVKQKTQGRGKVIGLSLKDRGAILPTGKMADICYWFDDNTGSFVSSNFYAKPFPRSMMELNSKELYKPWFGMNWERFRPDLDYTKYSGPDNGPGEGTGKKQGKEFPHPMHGGETKIGKPFHEAVYTSPFGNELTWEAARHVIETENLGQDNDVDYLVISYSSNDAIGHVYGPDSWEVLDVTLRSDALMAKMIEYFDMKVGRENYILAMAADHGMCPVADVSKVKGLDAGRIKVAPIVVLAEWNMRSRHGDHGTYFEKAVGSDVYLNHDVIRKSGASLAEVQKTLADFLKEQGDRGILTAFTSTELEDSSLKLPWPGDMVRESHFPGRSGDVTVVARPYWYATTYETGGTHGSPHEYDTHIPLIFFGGNIQPQLRKDRITPYAMAVTLADSINMKLKDAVVEPPQGIFK